MQSEPKPAKIHNMEHRLQLVIKLVKQVKASGLPDSRDLLGSPDLLDLPEHPTDILDLFIISVIPSHSALKQDLFNNLEHVLQLELTRDLSIKGLAILHRQMIQVMIPTILMIMLLLELVVPLLLVLERVTILKALLQLLLVI